MKQETLRITVPEAGTYDFILSRDKDGRAVAFELYLHKSAPKPQVNVIRISASSSEPSEPGRSSDEPKRS